MPNTNFQTIHQMGQAINEVVRQATGRDAVQNIDMDYVTVAQNSRLVPGDGYSGNPITFNAPKKGQLVDILLGMVPQQNLNGYGYAWPPGAGKNMLNIASLVRGYPSNTAVSNASPRQFDAGTYVLGIAANNYYGHGDVSGTVSDNSIRVTSTAIAYGLGIPIIGLQPGGQYALSAFMNNGILNTSFYKEDGTYITSAGSNHRYFTVPADAYYTVLLFLISNVSEPAVFSDIQLEAGNEPSAYAPYSNVCPITGRDAVTVTANGTDYATDLPQTVYGGTLNMATGELLLSWKLITVGEVSWARVSGRFYATANDLVDGVTREIPLRSSIFQVVDDGRPCADVPDYGVYATGGNGNYRIYVNCSATNSATTFATMFADAQIAYPLEQPITLTVPKQMIDTLAGNNTISTDADSMEVTVYYYEDV